MIFLVFTRFFDFSKTTGCERIELALNDVQYTTFYLRLIEYKAISA